MDLTKFSSNTLIAVLISFVLSACSTTLAPSYDKALFDGVTEVNTKIMELFASLSSGTIANTFSKRENTYNSIIGKVDALALQSNARPIPENRFTKKVNLHLESRGRIKLPDDEIPSVASLEEISKNLNKMKEKDKKDGLKPGAVKAFKNAVIISIDQALTYEAFLDR